MATANFVTTENFPIVCIDDETYEEIYLDYDDMMKDVEGAFETLNLKFHKVKVLAGYYEGGQIVFEEIYNPNEMDNDDTRYYFDMCRSKAIQAYDAEIRKINRRIDKFCKESVWEKLGVVGRFSDGEVVYQKIS